MNTSEDELDRLLKISRLQPSDGFSQSVMTAVRSESLDEKSLTSSRINSGVGTGFRLITLAKWVALGLGGFFGFAHSLYFVVGLWFVTSAA